MKTDKKILLFLLFLLLGGQLNAAKESGFISKPVLDQKVMLT